MFKTSQIFLTDRAEEHYIYFSLFENLNGFNQ